MASRDIVIYSGPAGTAYYDYGTQYAAFLRDKGLIVHVVETAGALDNLERLASDNGAAVGFAQSGIEREADDRDRLAELAGLASVAFEPFWVFVRRTDDIESLKDLAGKRVAAGPLGNGSRAVALLLFADNGIKEDVEIASFTHIKPEEVALELTAGNIDAACIVSARSDVVENLLDADTLVPLSLPRTAAYARRHPDLDELVVPAGAFDVARDLPSTDLNLVAPTTNLVGTGELHPAAVGVLLEAAKEIHRPASLFAPQQTFPNTRHVSLPLSRAAVRYFERGPNILHRFLPFRLAEILGWLVALLTPFATAALFLFKAVPGLIQARFKMRLLGLYRRLERIEKASPHADAQTLLDELTTLERESAELNVPRALEAPFFEFRQNVHDVRDRISQTAHG